MTEAMWKLHLPHSHWPPKNSANPPAQFLMSPLSASPSSMTPQRYAASWAGLQKLPQGPLRGPCTHRAVPKGTYLTTALSHSPFVAPTSQPTQNHATRFSQAETWASNPARITTYFWCPAARLGAPCAIPAPGEFKTNSSIVSPSSIRALLGQGCLSPLNPHRLPTCFSRTWNTPQVCKHICCYHFSD